jgi:NADH dehydrogenase
MVSESENAIHKKGTAGPTGVEMAGSIAELAKRTLVDDFRYIKPSEAKIVWSTQLPRVLPAFAESLSESALKQLAELGVEVRVNTRILEVKRSRYPA